MPTAVPISFASSAQRQNSHGIGANGSLTDHPVMISPNMQQPWRGSPMSYSILARSVGKQNSFGLGSFVGSATFNDLSEFRVNGVPSSIESEAGKILRALHGEDSLDLIQNYSCCGMDLHDLHALLEHIEEVHVVLLDSPSLRASTDASVPTSSIPPVSSSLSESMSMAMDEDNSAFDPDAMDLDDSSSGSSPPSTPPVDLSSAVIGGGANTTSATTTPIHTAFDPANLVGRASRALSKGTMSGYNTPRGMSPHPSTPGGGADHRSETSMFNPYASYSDFSALMPGTVRTPTHQSPPSAARDITGNLPAGTATSPTGANSSNGGSTLTSIPPALLFSPSAQSTPNASRAGTPTPSAAVSRNGSLSGPSSSSSGAKKTPLGLMTTSTPGASTSTSGSASMPSTPTTPSHSSGGGSSGGVSKPFRCPTVGCNKSYKQANGLKYHITHGQCNFMPRDPALEGLNESEADEKSRPYVCQVGSCTRRYKNMNGLRYHYQHSGQHGAVGLALLASGQHSLQTGLKDVNVGAGDVREQHLLAAQALQRSQQQAQATLAQTTTTSAIATPSAMTNGVTTAARPTPGYLSQLQQSQAAAHKAASTTSTTTPMQPLDARILAARQAGLGGISVGGMTRMPPAPATTATSTGFQM